MPKFARLSWRRGANSLPSDAGSSSRGAFCMPKINLAAPEIRAKYRRSLEAGEKSTFDSLVGLLQAPSNDLDWYAKLGGLVKELRENEKQSSHGNDWFNFLAEALGVSAS